MKPGTEFFVIQCFDEQGYHSCAFAETLAECEAMAAMKKNKALVAMSVPFVGKWSPLGIPDVTLPGDFKTTLAAIDKGEERND